MAWKVIPDTSSRWEQRQSWALVPTQPLRMCTPSGRSCLVQISPLSWCRKQVVWLKTVIYQWLHFCLPSNCLMSPCRVQRISAESSNVQLYRPQAAPEPIPQLTVTSLPHPSSYNLRLAFLRSVKLLNTNRCWFALSCSKLSLPSSLPLCEQRHRLLVSMKLALL